MTVTSDDLKTMNYTFQGQPFIDVPATSVVILNTMLYPFQAQPFVRNSGTSEEESPAIFMGCNC